MFLTLEGPDSFWPLRAKAQLLGALVKPRSFLLTQACLVRPDLFDLVLNRPISLVCQQDNASVIQMVHGGYSAKLRHLKKVHKLNLPALYELFSDPQVTLQYIKSALQIADPFTKALEPCKWNAALELLNIQPP
jgi:hypothetical protein